MAKTTAQKLREIFFGMPSTAYKSIQNPESQPTDAEIAKAVPFPVVKTGGNEPIPAPVKQGDILIAEGKAYIAVTIDGTLLYREITITE